MIRSLLAVACSLVFLSATLAEEKPTLELKLSVQKGNLAWPYDLGPKEFQAKIAELQKDKEAANFPKPPSMVVTLQIVNTGKEKVTVNVDGDPNQVAFTLKGPAVTTVQPLLAFTTDFRLPKAVVLEPGKSHEIQLTQLSDGFRKVSRYVYPLAPGEFTLSATYQLATEDGGKGPLLKSNEAKFTVDAPAK